MQAVVEFIARDSAVIIRTTGPDGAGLELELEPDEARDYSNRLGECIQYASMTGDDNMPDFSAWLPDEAEVPEAAPQVASWLPASVQRAQALEDIAEARAERAAERERISRAEAAHDAAVAAHLASAAMRGEYPAPMDVAAGNVGRDLMDVLAAARGDLERDYAPTPVADERFVNGEALTASVQRAAEYDLDRQLRRAQQLHDDLTAVRARTDYAGTLAAAREKSEARHAIRSETARTPMIYR